MKNNALIVTTTPYMIRQFLMNDIALLTELGMNVEIATNMQCFSVMDEATLSEFGKTLDDMGITVHQTDFTRSITDLKSLCGAYAQMKRLLKEKEYGIVHTHTPIAGAVTRAAAIHCPDTGVIYTAHGFHFYKGAPLKNWLLYFTAEWLCSWHTDVLVTINREDYVRARRHLHAKRTEYVPGVGIDLSRFADSVSEEADDSTEKRAGNITAGSTENNTETEKLRAIRQELGCRPQDILLLSVGELNENKNHGAVIRALGEIRDSRIHYAIAGSGDLREKLISLAKQYGIENRVHLAGFRKDVADLYKAADIFVFPSRREGLSVALMEAMACSKPVVCSRIRGNTDLIAEGEGGFFFEPDDIGDIRRQIIKICKADLKGMGEFNRKYVENFSVEKVTEIMRKIYRKALSMNRQ